MNDQSQMMNPAQLMSQAQMMSQPQVMNPVQPQILSQNPAVLVQSQAMSQPPPQVLTPVQSQSQMMSHVGAMNQQQPPMMMRMNQRSYKPWPPQQQSSMEANKFQNQQNPSKFNSNINNNFVPSKPRSSTNWKGKNINNKDQRRMDKPMSNKPIISNAALAAAGPSGAGGYKPPSLNELQTQNRMKARKYYHPKKKFNNRFAPYAPRNTTSFIIRAKKAGGIASLVSPCPVTPAVLPTPIFSPSREVLGDMAKEEWGVDGYGSMKGLIRLRSPGNEAEVHDEEDEDEGNGSSESDVEEHVEVERRLDHDLSRFEMIYPTYGGGDYSYNNILENRVDDQDTHIAQLEEENLTLKERLFLMERELGDLRRRLQFLERQQGQGISVMPVPVEDINEEVVENVYENDENENESDGGSDVGGTGNDNNDEMEYVGGNGERRTIRNDVKGSHDVCMEETVSYNDEIGKDAVKNKISRSELVVRNEVIEKDDEAKGEEVGNDDVMEKLIAKEEELSKGDGFVNEIVQDVLAEESNLGKSIGSGD